MSALNAKCSFVQPEFFAFYGQVPGDLGLQLTANYFFPKLILIF